MSMGLTFRLAFLVAAVVTRCVGFEGPRFYRNEDGSVSVSLPDPDVRGIVISVADQHTRLFRTTVGTWAAVLPAVDDGCRYTVQYFLYNSTVFTSVGTIQALNSGQVLSPPNHLQRRATTVLFDDFTSGHIDGAKWNHAVSASGGGNHEFNMYTPLPENSYVKNHVLYIRPTITADHFGEAFISGSLDINALWGTCTGSQNDCHRSGYGNVPVVMSALLSSKAHIRYGRVDVVAQLPKGDWIWPAIWMLPTESHYGGWPRSGEIDIMEARCNRQYVTKNEGWLAGVNQDHATVHFGPAWNDKTSRGGQFTLQGATLGDGYHTYWMDWTADYIKLGIDAHTILALNTPAHGYWQEGHFTGTNVWSSGGRDAPFDRPFYLILNVAVGGQYFNHGLVNHPYEQPWHDGWAAADQMKEFWQGRHLWQPTWAGEEAAMKIRSVRMQQY